MRIYRVTSNSILSFYFQSVFVKYKKKELNNDFSDTITSDAYKSKKHKTTDEVTGTHHGVSEILGDILRDVDQLTISGCD